MNRNFWHIPAPIPRQHTYTPKKEYSIYDNANIYEFLKRESAKKEGLIKGLRKGLKKGMVEGVKRALFDEIEFDQEKHPGFKKIFVET